MFQLVILRIALRALAKNKLRAGLTVLGVVIGIAAVTAMVSIGLSASGLVQSQFESLGTNVIVVFPQRAHRDGVRQSMLPSLTAADSDAIAAELQTSVRASSPIVITAGQVIYNNNNWSPRDIVGTGASYLEVRNWAMHKGEMFTERDVTAAAPVCIIGQTVATKLFQTLDPVDEMVRIKNVPFRIIGVLEVKGANLVGEDQDDIVFMPYTTAKKRLQGSSFDNVDVILVSGKTADAETEINLLLAERHHIRPGQSDDFHVQNLTEIARVLGIITGTMTALLSSIAGISLLVGGVGIMNIMLVSVTERTREIGIRMAVGARPRDIPRQFLMEAVLLSSIGGAVGVTLGIAASAAVTTLINHVSTGAKWPITISFTAAGVAMIFAAAVGIFFGYYPARRAANLDPIEALRYE